MIFFTGDYSALTPSFACCYVTDRKSAGEAVHYYWTLCIKFTSLTVCVFVFLYLFFSSANHRTSVRK